MARMTGNLFSYLSKKNIFAIFKKNEKYIPNRPISHDSADDSDKTSLALGYYKHLVSLIQVSVTMVKFLEMRNTSQISQFPTIQPTIPIK